MVLILSVAGPVIRYAGAAGERDAPVDDQRLAVRPMIETPDRTPAHRVVPFDLAMLLQRVQNVLADEGAADGVQEDLDFDSLLAFARQRDGEFLADVSRPIDERFHGDGFSRRRDGVKHRRVIFISVVQNLDGITVHKRHTCGAYHTSEEFRRFNGKPRLKTVTRALFIGLYEISEGRKGKGRNRELGVICIKANA